MPVLRVDGLFLKAVAERRNRMEEEDVKRHGVAGKYSTRQITAIFGYEYLQGNNKVPYEVAAQIMNVRRGEKHV